MNVFKPRKSSYILGIGVVGLVIGQAIYSGGQQQNIEAALSLYADDGSGAILFGVIVSLISLSFLVNGIVNLARSVDYLAEREHASSVIAASTPSDGDADV